MKKLTAIFALAIAASMSQALILNWTVENDARYCADYAFVQLVAVYNGEDEDQPKALYSYWIDLEGSGIHEAEKGPSSWSASMNLDEYMTLDEVPGDDTEPITENFNFTGYSFYFRMLDEAGRIMGNTTGPCDTVYKAPIAWDDVYNQYVLDAGHLTPTVWVVGVPEPCSAALMMLGVSALLLRRRTA